MSLLEGKVGLITGAGMGIGRAIAQACAREGAKVVVADFNAETGRESVQLIQAAGGEALFVEGDGSKEEQVEASIAAAVESYGRLDVACNSAGGEPGIRPHPRVQP